MTLPTRKDDFPTCRTVARPVANLGNTCYMNAVLQALAHAPELCLAMDCEAHRSCCPIAAENKEKMRRSASPDGSASSKESEPRRPTATRKSRRSGRKTPPDQAEDSPNAIKFCALCELEEHLQNVHDATLKDKPFAPTNFVHGFIDQVAPWFKLGVQEDSHEFLRLLIDAMQKSCEKARITDANNNSRDDSSSPSSISNAAKIEDDKDTEYPFSLFRGTVESTVTCGSCGAASSTLDPIEDIGLEVTAPQPPGTNTRIGTERTSSRNVSPVPPPQLYDVKTAFQRYSQAEALDAGYKCEKCGKVGKATKQSRLASIPPILTLHLKRFRYGGGNGEGGGRRSRSELGQLLGSSDLYAGKSGSAKIEGHIKFDVLFDLQPFLTEELQERGSMLCRLFAVIVHAGKNSHSGHYIAYVRNIAKNEWWKMDDGRITNVTVGEVQSAEAYMLFYRVVQHPVATRLEKEYKMKVENCKNAESDDPQGTKEAGAGDDSASERMLNLRKRPLVAPSEENGESWYRTKTSMPPYLRGVVKFLEEKIADNAEVQEEFLRRFRECIDGGGNPDQMGEECASHRDLIMKALKQASQWIERVNGTAPSKQLTPRVTTSLETIVADDKLVAVVEPEEEMDLL